MCSQVHLRMCTVIKSLVINKMEAGLFECSICNHYTATTMAAVLKHVGCVHAHEPNFHIICGINECPRTYKNYHSFRKHLTRNHPDCISSHQIVTHSQRLDESPHDNSVYFDDNAMVESRESTNNHSAALFILKTKEVLNISQTATDQILNDVTEMIENTVSQIELRVSSILTANGSSMNDIKGLRDIFGDQDLRNPFHAIKTQYMQQKYFQDHLGLVVITNNLITN